MEQTMTSQGTATRRESAGGRSRGALAQRWVVTLHMAALAAQMVFALLLLGGVAGTLQLHSVGAWLVLALGLIQAVVVVSLWPSRSIPWKAAAALVLLAELAQIYFGRSGNLPAHVTLGTALWGLSLALLVQVWAPNWGRRPLVAAS
jgi:hypothetical protein